MDEIKRCIFHLPYTADPENHPSGTNIRPGKMLRAFREIGYDVFEITGESAERREKIALAMQMIGEGVSFDFVYSESETMPTALTDKDHIPRHPFMDFHFLRLCRESGIPVGLFYRDAYWRSAEYKNATKGLKHAVAHLLYRNDLSQYKKVTDILYVPSEEFKELLRPEMNGFRMLPLPSGCDLPDNCGMMRPARSESGHEPPLRLLYVGGISVGEAYDLTMLFDVVRELPGVEMTVCVREADWNRVCDHYSVLIGNNVNIVHKSGNDLKVLLEYADIGLMFFAPSPYRSICMPSKLFEYLSSLVPVLALAGTASGNYVLNQGIGLCADYSRGSLKAQITRLQDNRGIVRDLRERCVTSRSMNSWIARAHYVAETLRDTSAD